MAPADELGRESSSPSPGHVRIAGAVATGLALAALWGASLVVVPVVFPPAALAQALIHQTPAGVATFFIEALGHWAMRLLALAAVAGSIALGAEVLARARRAGVAAVVMGAMAVFASLANPVGRSGLFATSVAIALAVYLYVVSARWALGALSASGSEPDAERRRVLLIGAFSAVGLAAGGWVLGRLFRGLSGPDTDVALVTPRAPATEPARAPFPEIPGLSEEVTSAGDHYVVDINLFKPSVEASSWALTVSGLVARELRLGFEELQRRFDVVEEYAVLACVSNEVGGDLVGNSAWGGVRLRDVLEEAGIREGSSDVVFRAADGYSDSITVADALDPAVLLAVSQNGRPLTQEHGFPCRVRIPRIYGMKNVKWLTSIRVVGDDYRGYWQRRGWSDAAIVKTQSRIDVAGDQGAAHLGEATWIAGVAWAGDRGISEVEVSTNGGASWDRAMLKDPLAPLAWRLWAYRWTPDRPGEAEVICRATDGRGTVQTAETTSPHPDGASGHHRVTVRVA